MRTFIVFLIFFLASINWAIARQADGFHSVDEADPAHSQIQILYFANLNGNLENCGCGDPPLGGMDNLAYWLTVFRQKDLKSIVVAGGDILNSYPDKDLNSAILQSLGKIHPDIYAPGEQELLDGSAYFIAELSKNNLCLLGTNYALEKANICTRNTFHAKKSALQFLSYFSKSVYHVEMPQKGYKLTLNRFNKSYQKLNKDIYNVLLYHGSLQNFDRFIQDYPNFSLALISHDQRLYVKKDINLTTVLPGSDGEYLIRIVLYGSSSQLKPWIQKIPMRVATNLRSSSNNKIKSRDKK